MGLLIGLVILLIVVGLLLYLIDHIPGIPADFKGLIRAVIVVIAVLYLLGYLLHWVPGPRW